MRNRLFAKVFSLAFTFYTLSHVEEEERPTLVLYLEVVFLSRCEWVYCCCCCYCCFPLPRLDFYSFLLLLPSPTIRLIRPSSRLARDDDETTTQRKTTRRRRLSQIDDDDVFFLNWCQPRAWPVVLKGWWQFRGSPFVVFCFASRFYNFKTVF